jgi:hypothetical protein
VVSGFESTCSQTILRSAERTARAATRRTAMTATTGDTEGS